jgi:hypothetical protein
MWQPGRSAGRIAVSAVLAFAALPPAGALHAEAPLGIDAVKFAVLAHDVAFAEGKEGGADINGEVLFRSPVEDAAVAGAPSWLRWLVQPRPHVGFEANTAGDTSQGYFGLTWTLSVAQHVLRGGDGVHLGISFGPSFNNGEIRARRADRKSLGSNALFRECFELGYRVTPRWEVSLLFDHVSNAGLARYNQSINDAGLRVGVDF